MALEEIELDLSPVELPDPVSRFLKEADRQIDEFFETERNKRYPKFIPSDAQLLYNAIDFLTRNDLTLGKIFCEWGSGFGVGIGLASLLGYEAFGIEIEPELVEISSRLADDLKIPVEIICSNYIPEGFDSYEGIGGEILLEPSGFAGGDRSEAPPFYEGMDYPIEEIDLFYVYPRPDDQDFMLKMFDALAGEGAILLAYFENAEICGYRRVYEE